MNRPAPISLTGASFGIDWRNVSEDRMPQTEGDVLGYRPVGSVRPEPSAEELRYRNWQRSLYPPETEFQLRLRLIREAGGF